jgi:uncharacterized SAM-binding protein YcdF (DUF218 family)
MKTIIRVTSYFVATCITIFLYVSIVITHYGNKSFDLADGAIILGAATWDGAPSPVFKARIDHAIDLYNEGKVRKLYFTGGTKNTTQLSESETAQKYAISQGVLSEDIFIENTSRITSQNFANILPLLDMSHTYLVITDPLHQYRASRIANKLEIKTFPSPTPYSVFITNSTQIPFLIRETFFTFIYWFFKL